MYNMYRVCTYTYIYIFMADQQGAVHGGLYKNLRKNRETN